MDAAALGDRLPEGTQKPLLGPWSPSMQCRHRESSKVPAGLAFCEMLSQYPQSAFQGSAGVSRGSAAVCDPHPPRPFARYRLDVSSKGKLITTCLSQGLEKTKGGAASYPQWLAMPGEFQVTVCGVTVCPFSEHKGNQRPKCL